MTPGPEQRTGERLDRVGCFVGVDEVEGVAADEIVGLVPEPARRLRTHVGHRTRSVGDDDELRRALTIARKRAARLSDCRFASTRSVWSCTTQMTPSSERLHAALVRAHDAVDEQLVLVADARAGRARAIERTHRDVGLTRRQQIADAAALERRTVHPVPAEVTTLAVEQEHQPARAPYQRPDERIGVLPEIRHTGISASSAASERVKTGASERLAARLARFGCGRRTRRGGSRLCRHRSCRCGPPR